MAQGVGFMALAWNACTELLIPALGCRIPSLFCHHGHWGRGGLCHVRIASFSLSPTSVQKKHFEKQNELGFDTYY